MGRHILNGVFIANETISWIKKKKVKGALLKLDFQIAYDSFNWKFLEHIMEIMGFGENEDTG